MTKRVTEDKVTAGGKQFAVYAVYVEYAAWHRSPTGWYGWAREVGTKRRGVVTDALLTAEEARAAAKAHVLGGDEKSLAQTIYEVDDMRSTAWAMLSPGERAVYGRMADAAMLFLMNKP